ncbi:MAG: DNA repair protein RecO [Elusimicrobiota bacterium]
MSRYISTNAIIIKSYNVKERDRIVHLFTKSLGRTRCVVKGINKTSHKYGSNLDLFSIHEVTLYRPSFGHNHILTGAKLENSLYNIRKDIDRFMAASMVIEIINNMIHDASNEDGGLFDLIKDTLTGISDSGDPEKIVIWFWFKFLHLLGYSFELDECTQCKKQLTNDAEKIFVSPHAGGIICFSCLSRMGNRNELSIGREAVDCVNSIVESGSFDSIKKCLAECSKKCFNDTMCLTKKTMEYYIEKKLKANIF